MIEIGTVEHEGRTFTAYGAQIDDAYARVYVGKHLNPWFPMPGSVAARMLASGLGVRQPASHVDRYAATDWHGNVVGELREVSTWRTPGRWSTGEMHAYKLTLTDGRTYAVRGYVYRDALGAPVARSDYDDPPS